MPHRHQCNPQDGAPAKDPSRVKKRNKSNPSTCTSSYMLPTKSERMRQLTSLSSPSIAAPHKRPSTAKSKPPLSKKSPPARIYIKKHGSTCPPTSTLLFPKKHSATQSRYVNKKSSHRYAVAVNDRVIEIDNIATFDKFIDVDPDSADELESSRGELVTSPQQVTSAPPDTLEDVSSASLLSGKYQDREGNISMSACSAEAIEVTRRNLFVENESKSTVSSTAQLVRQCSQCKMLYQTSHTCCVKNHTPNAKRRPRTAPAARIARPQSPPGTEQDSTRQNSHQINIQRNKRLPPRPASSGNVRKNLPVGAFSGNRKLHRHRRNSTSPNTCAIPNSLTRSIAESFACSGESAVRAAAINMKYDYAAISDNVIRRPKSASSLWRHRPSSILRVLEL